MANELRKQGKRVLLLWLAGGASQLETWDPKPGRPTSGFLGGRYAAMSLERSLMPENMHLPPGLSERDHTEREHLRQYLSDRFNHERDAAEVQGYNSTYARVRGLMQCDSLFDLE